MTIHRFRFTVVTCLLLMTTFASGALAQRQGQKPAPTPQGDLRVERPSQPSQPTQPTEPTQDELRREYDDAFYRRPTLRLFQNYMLPQNETIREAFSVLADVQIDGIVRGDVGVVMGSAKLGPTAVIEGSLHVIGGSATVAKGARIRRDVVVIGGTLDAPIDFTTGGEHVIIGTPVIGDTLRALGPWLTRGLLLGRLIVPDIGWVWIVVGVLFFFGLLFNHIFARQVGLCADTLARRPVGAFLTGLLVIILAGPAVMIVSATVIGLPFAIAAMLAANIIGKLGVTRAIGRSVIGESEPRNRAHAFRSFAIGSGILIVALMIPIVGLMTWALVGVFGFGTAVMTFISSWRKERPTPAPGSSAPPPAGPPPVTPASFDAPGPIAPVSPGSATFAENAPHVASGDVFRDEPPPIASPAATYADVAAPAPPAAAPAPSYAAPAFAPAARIDDLRKYPRASFFDRLVAFALDAVLVAIANSWLVGDFGFGRGPDNTFLPMLFAYHIAFWAWKGTTLGGIICNIRMVRTTGEAPRFVDVLVRGLSAIFSVAALFIGCLWMLTDPERQMWHDKFAGTLVVKVPREVVLAEFPAESRPARSNL